MHKYNFTISTTKDGNMSFKYGKHSDVIDNRIKFLTKNNINPNNTVCMVVEMKDNIIIVDENSKGRGFLNPKDSVVCDCLITNSKDINLFLLIADCLPIVIFDEIKGVLALVHGGWPNTDLHICPKVVEKMKTKFGTSVSDISVVIGPGIQKESLIYDENIFKKTTTDWGEHIRDIGNGKYSIDNTGFTISQLLDSGIQERRITVDYTDVAKERRYFSHSRDYHNGIKDQGRFCMVTSLV